MRARTGLLRSGTAVASASMLLMESACSCKATNARKLADHSQENGQRILSAYQNAGIVVTASAVGISCTQE